MQVELNATPLLTIDEVENVQRQRIASFIGHVFPTDLCGNDSQTHSTIKRNLHQRLS